MPASAAILGDRRRGRGFNHVDDDGIDASRDEVLYLRKLLVHVAIGDLDLHRLVQLGGVGLDGLDDQCQVRVGGGDADADIPGQRRGGSQGCEGQPRENFLHHALLVGFHFVVRVLKDIFDLWPRFSGPGSSGVAVITGGR
jgi:hypothetical protein